MKNLIIVLFFAVFLNGCATLEDKLQDKYGSPFKYTNYDGNSYKVLVNHDRKEMVVKEDDSVAEKMLSPKYGLIGVLVDSSNVLKTDEKYKDIADNFLSNNYQGCKTNGVGYKHFRECYEFQYICNSKIEPVEIKKVTPIAIQAPQIKSSSDEKSNATILPQSRSVYLTCNFNSANTASIKLDESSGKITHSNGEMTFNANGFFSAKTISYRSSDLGDTAIIYEINRETLEIQSSIELDKLGRNLLSKGQCEITTPKNNKI